MEATKKFRLKRQYKTLVWLAYGCIIFFAAFLTTVIIIRKHSEGDWSKPVIMISLIVGLMLPLFMGIVFMTYSSFKRQELLNYRKQILVHRARKFASRAIEFLQQGKVREAVDEYIKCSRYPEHSLDDYVYGMLISACIQSSNEKLHKIGEEKFNKLRDEYNPDKVVL